MSSLSENFKTVDAQTSNFQRQCEGLLAAQKRDTGLVTDIEYNLQFYDFLDPASRRLNAPGAGNTVRGQDFSDMLRQLDECLDYMEAHVRIAAPKVSRNFANFLFRGSKRKQKSTDQDIGFSSRALSRSSEATSFPPFARYMQVFRKRSQISNSTTLHYPLFSMPSLGLAHLN